MAALADQATLFSPLEHISAEEYRRATEVTYLGTMWGTMAALKRMRARRSHARQERGYTRQQTDEPVSSNRPDNLFASVPGDCGARGDFDARAKGESWQLWWITHRWGLATAAVALIIVGAVLLGGI